MLKRWIESVLQNVVATVLIALVPAAGIAYLARVGSQWTSPLLLGGLAAALSSLTALLLRRQIGLPLRRVTADTNNIEGLVRLWLSNFRVAVKNDPQSDAYFRVIATMDSGTKMAVGRLRSTEVSTYVILRSDITPTPEELQMIADLPGNEGVRLSLDIRLELGRFRVGYTALGFPLQPFSIFKRIPINENLTEHSLMNAMEEVEAAIACVSILYGLALQSCGKDVVALAKRVSQ